MYLDLEVQADRYEVEQELLQEIAKENFFENRMKRQPRQMTEKEREELRAFGEEIRNSFKFNK